MIKRLNQEVREFKATLYQTVEEYSGHNQLIGPHQRGKLEKYFQQQVYYFFFFFLQVVVWLQNQRETKEIKNKHTLQVGKNNSLCQWISPDSNDGRPMEIEMQDEAGHASAITANYGRHSSYQV